MWEGKRWLLIAIPLWLLAAAIGVGLGWLIADYLIFRGYLPQG